MTAETRPSEYSRFAPLFDELNSLPAADRIRSPLREQLIVGHLPLVRHVARRYRGRGESLEDLEQVGMLALVKAVDRFDPERGFDFLAFAIPTIAGELKRHFRDRTWALRVPRRLRELQSVIHAEVGLMSQQLGRAPRPSEIAARLDVTVEEVLEAIAVGQAHHSRSLDELMGEHDDSLTLGNAIGEIDAGLDAVEYREALVPLLDALPRRERAILLLRFYGGLTQTQIAQQVGISQMHVSRLLAVTIQKLRLQLHE